ncbi:hypothetical protein ADUPG1_012178 [Aduncisulcus paluster]|uniref:Uncharacterized protein n=1 Tax=Aduncisulcus paluster TaxID=2918883 RepID=A0ABQ5K3D0_9EUKA|nr:hypothetical protein ADUPG1_012178 [Aduncisulcus paluster]
MSSSPIIQLVEPEYIHKGSRQCSAIPFDAPNILVPNLMRIKARDVTRRKKSPYRNQRSYAQNMVKGECHKGSFTHISIPFSSSSPMKGVFICLNDYFVPPSFLIFQFTSSKKESTFKKYEFPDFIRSHWFFLPVDLPDVVLCEISGKGRWEEHFRIVSLVFIRKETAEEILVREAREKLWSEASVIRPKFVKEGDRYCNPIPKNDPIIIYPFFKRIKGKNVSYSKESKEYNQSSNAKIMLRGQKYVDLSHLSIPFPSPSPMKGAYICVNWNDSSPSLLFTFTDCDGKKTYKKYEFTPLKCQFEWHFLPIDLDNVVLCEIEGKGMWKEKNSVCFSIYCLFFTRPRELIEAERLSLLPWK